MTSEEFDRRMDRLTERHEALRDSVELLAGSTRDLRAIAETLITQDRERRERDARFLTAISQVLKQWAGENSE